MTTDRKEVKWLVRQMAGEIIFQTRRATSAKCKEHKFKVPKVSLVCFCLSEGMARKMLFPIKKKMQLLEEWLAPGRRQKNSKMSLGHAVLEKFSKKEENMLKKQTPS